MRYTVGEKYPFVNVSFTRKKLMLTMLYVPWSDTDLKLNMKLFTCLEHHRVPTKFREEQGPTADGFIFIEEATGNKFRNQYPTAYYGQLDDSNDRICRPFNEIEPEPIFQDALCLLDTIQRGIRMMKDDDANKRNLLYDYLFEMKNNIEEITGQRVEFCPISYTKKDGSVKIFNDLLQAVLL